MWLRTEIDATYRELALLTWRSVFPFSPATLRSRANKVTGRSDFVFGSSVRSLFWVLLEELAWPAGSVVACSAVNIPQMEEILRLRNLRPEPVDIDAATFLPNRNQVEEAFRRLRPRGYLHAPYFGSRPEARFIQTLADQASVFTIDDRSQCFSSLNAAEPWADVTLFSLGPYKSPTAAGGAVALFRNPHIARSMRDRLEQLRPEPRSDQLRRLLKLLGTKLLSEPALMQIAGRVRRGARADYGDLLSKRIRQVADIDHVNEASLSRAPSRALCSCVVTVAERFSPARFRRRQHLAHLIAESLIAEIPNEPMGMPGFNGPMHSHWLIPVLTHHPESLIRTLREAGFDAARMAKTRPIGGSSATARPWNAVATELLRKLVLVPSDTRMSDSEAKRLSRLLQQHQASHDRCEK